MASTNRMPAFCHVNLTHAMTSPIACYQGEWASDCGSCILLPVFPLSSCFLSCLFIGLVGWVGCIGNLHIFTSGFFHFSSCTFRQYHPACLITLLFSYPYRLGNNDHHTMTLKTSFIASLLSDCSIFIPQERLVPQKVMNCGLLSRGLRCHDEN
ncbi:hypothetical protein EDB80DRAFT_399896 [Ilyonectria destructans]|nr:hypothetical protein EDB80DRAFT_399896 [Ilyonectria destructans]